jgi:protease YdgD
MKSAWMIVILPALFCPTWGSAQDLHPGIIGEDDRQIVQQRGAPWDAVGQVNVALHRLRFACTGTLVAPDTVITAAHCVIDPWASKPFPLHEIHFVAGVHADAIKGHSTAKCLRFLEGYRFVGPERIIPSMPAQKVPIEAFALDAVAIVLRDQIPVEPASLARAMVGRPGQRLVHAAYPADRRHILSAHFDCHILRTDLFGRLWLNDCDTHSASSGGPLFVEMEGKQKLAAIMVGTFERVANLALPASEWMTLIEAETCP